MNAVDPNVSGPNAAESSATGPDPAGSGATGPDPAGPGLAGGTNGGGDGTTVDIRRQEEIREYLAAVRSELADLPEDVRDELLEDLPAHLSEVVAESDRLLVERLGSAAGYAAELRAAAGIEAPPAEGREGWPGWLREAVSAAKCRTGRLLRPVDAALGRALGYERSVDFLALLAPAWWVLRGYVLGMLAAGMFVSNVRLIPSSWGGQLLVVVAVIGSVRFARARRKPQLVRLLGNVASAVIALVAIVGVLQFDDRLDDESVYDEPYAGIVDLYPYDGNGRPLTGVRLVDENGQAVRIGNPYRCLNGFESNAGRRPVTQEPYASYPLCPWPGAPAVPAASAPFSPAASAPFSPAASAPFSPAASAPSAPAPSSTLVSPVSPATRTSG